MNNLFDFAPHELSQDAFLRWICEQGNNKDDPQLKTIAFDFLDFLTGTQLKLNQEKCYINTYSQVDNTDISIDIFESQNSNKHSTIVIEDKVFASLHDDQLIRYNQSLDKWQSSKIFKVFYKTASIPVLDLEDLNRAKTDRDEWRLLDIGKIWEFFSKYKDLNNAIIKDYFNHIDKLYMATKGNPNKNAIELSHFEWKEFLTNEFDYLNKTHNGKHFEVTDYFGKYSSIIYSIPLNNSEHRLALEIFIRNDRNFVYLSTLFHHEFFENSKSKGWSIKNNRKFDDFRDKLIQSVESNNIMKKVKKNATNSFGKFKDYKKISNTFEIVPIIEEWCNLFDDIFFDKY